MSREHMQRIKAAAIMLDKEIPGWHRLVDVERLEMESCSLCVLGQVFGPEKEAQLRSIIGDRTPDYSQPSRWLNGRSGYHYGIPYLWDRNRATSPFGMSGTCEWSAEIIDRQLRDEFNNQPDQTINNQTETHDGKEDSAAAE